MSTASDGGGDETVSSAANSPKSKMKFMCSHGGKILPRSVDGHLKYVGGETRVVAVPRDINFTELMKKLSTICEGDMVLKYQLIPEDLDSLVSVRNDEDLKHMLDEYDHHGSEAIPKLRVFLFPSNPIVLENQINPVDPLAIEQRYIDAINGIVRTTTNGRLTPIKANCPSFSISSTCSSPKSTSPDSLAVDSTPHEFIMMDGYQNSRMQKVRSSPSLCNLNSSLHQSTNASSNHFSQHPHYYYQNHHQHHPYNQSHQSHRLPAPVPLGQTDFVRNPTPLPVLHGQILCQSRSYSASKNYLGVGSHNPYGGFDESTYPCRRAERAGSLPLSPRKNTTHESKVLR